LEHSKFSLHPAEELVNEQQKSELGVYLLGH
jgi:hypothetical protein